MKDGNCFVRWRFTPFFPSLSLSYLSPFSPALFASFGFRTFYARSRASPLLPRFPGATLRNSLAVHFRPRRLLQALGQRCAVHVLLRHQLCSRLTPRSRHNTSGRETPSSVAHAGHRASTFAFAFAFPRPAAPWPLLISKARGRVSR